MGLYDRDYGRDESFSSWQTNRGPKSATVILIVVNVAVFLLDLLTAGRTIDGVSYSRLAEYLAVGPDTLIRPWMWWQFVTYGFTHSTGGDGVGIQHILFNMIGLFFFGRAVEQRLGFAEFLRFYLVALVVGGIVGSAAFWLRAFLTGNPVGGSVIGASGAVIATTILFACYYPHSEILLMFVIPVKAWIVAVLYVGMDLYGALGELGGFEATARTAFEVHLSGAAFAGLYYLRGWNFRALDAERLVSWRQDVQQRSRRMKLKLHDPERKLEQEAVEADRILAKIHEHGEASLTASERRTLERYSRRQREKRRG